jgi:F0F1-type ATP synthase assembly protein I
MHPVELEGIFAIVLSLTIPIVAIIFGSIIAIRKKQSETELRKLLIENNTDLETAKALIEEKEKKSNKYSSLRWACILIGLGIGAFADFLLGLNSVDGIYFWIIIAFGIGLGLLVSFFVELKLQKNETKEE